MSNEKSENNIFTHCSEGNITVTIFENEFTNKEGETKTYLKAVPSASYKTKDNKTAHTNSYSLNQLSDAIRAMQRAENIMQQHQMNLDNDRVFPKLDAQTQKENEQEAGY